MSADIVERLEALADAPLMSVYPWADALRLSREAAAEIVRLRGEVANGKFLADFAEAQQRRTPAPAMPNGVEGLVELWRMRAENGEERTEFDKGYEQASDECADALESALRASATIAPAEAKGDARDLQYRRGFRDGLRYEADHGLADTDTPQPAGGEAVALVRQCGYVHPRHMAGPHDKTGCILPDKHPGEHRSVDDCGRVFLWSYDGECGCADCMSSDGDCCTIYHYETATPPAAQVQQEAPFNPGDRVFTSWGEGIVDRVDATWPGGGVWVRHARGTPCFAAHNVKHAHPAAGDKVRVTQAMVDAACVAYYEAGADVLVYPDRIRAALKAALSAQEKA